MRIPAWLVLVSIAAAIILGRMTAPAAPVQLRVDTVRVQSAELLELVQGLALEAGGLGARLAGRTELEPEVIYVASDPIPAPEACQLDWVIQGGQLTVSPVVRVGTDSTGAPAYQVSLLDGLDVSRCDDALSATADGRVVCDVPRLGHLSLAGAGGMAGRDPWGWLGLEWTPYWRSSWRATAGARAWGDGLTWEVGISRRLVGVW